MFGCENFRDFENCMKLPLVFMEKGHETKPGIARENCEMRGFINDLGVQLYVSA